MAKIGIPTHARRTLLRCGVALTTAVVGALAAGSGIASASGPFATIEGGAVRGAAVAGVDEFLGLPYAAAPTGDLRWRPPQPPAAWRGVRDATAFGPSCPQQP